MPGVPPVEACSAHLDVVGDVAAGLEGDGLTGSGVTHGAQQQPGEQADVRHAVQELLGTLGKQWMTVIVMDTGTWVVMVLGGLNSQGMYFVILDSLLSTDIRAISRARN